MIGPVEVVYVGGPRHGECEVVASATAELVFPTVTTVEGEAYWKYAVYVRRELADTPGAIAYQYRTSAR